MRGCVIFKFSRRGHRRKDGGVCLASGSASETSMVSDFVAVLKLVLAMSKFQEPGQFTALSP